MINLTNAREQFKYVICIKDYSYYTYGRYGRDIIFKKGDKVKIADPELLGNDKEYVSIDFTPLPKDSFIPLDEYREQQLNNILE